MGKSVVKIMSQKVNAATPNLNQQFLHKAGNISLESQDNATSLRCKKFRRPEPWAMFFSLPVGLRAIIKDLWPLAGGLKIFGLWLVAMACGCGPGHPGL